MKKLISKNIFYFSHFIIELKKEKQKKLFLNLFWFKINFKKQKLKFFEFIFWFQIILLIKLKNEKWKIRFVFKSKNELYFRYTDSSGTQIIEITFPVIFTSMVSHVIQEQVRIMSIEISRCTMITRAPSICCLENNWFILIFISLAATFTNHISRSSYREVFS